MTCGIKNDCVSKFGGKYESYCHVHYANVTMYSSLTHAEDDPCYICKQSMGPHNPVTSLKMVCCSSGEWYHKNCLKKQAYEQADNFGCKHFPHTYFNEWYLYTTIKFSRSVYIADNDPENEPLQKKGEFIKNGYMNKPSRLKQKQISF